MGFIFFVAVIAIIVYLSSSSVKANRAKWQEAAQSLGLMFYPGSFGSVGRLSGQMRGHRISVSTFSRGSGKSSQTYTKYSMEYRQRIDLDFKMTRQRMMNSIGKAFGLQDIEVGDPAFDNQILLQGGEPERIVRFLSPALRDETRYLLATYPDLVITNELVTVEKRGTDSEPTSMSRTIRCMATYCDLLAERAGSNLPDAADAMDLSAPNMDEDVLVIEPVEPPLNPLASSNPIVPDPPWVPIEMEDESIEEEVPVDNDPGPEPVMDEEPEQKDPVAETEAPVAAAVLDLKAVAEELSGGSSANTLIAPRRFEEEFKGRRIEGKGILKRVNRFNYDPVFTKAEGVKATFSICELAGPYSKTQVLAVVKYPAQEYDALEAKIDATFPITGTFVAFDAMMNQYYIEP